MYRVEKNFTEEDITNKQRLIAHFLTVLMFSGLGAFLAHRVGFYFYSHKALLIGLMFGIICSCINIVGYYGYLKRKITSKDYLQIEAYYSEIGILARVFYGGVVEEVIFRWGLLSLFVWLFQLVSLDTKFTIALSVFISSFMFAWVNIPAIKLVATEPKREMYVYTIVVNTLVGVFATIAFLEAGLVAAIIVHMIFHLTWYPLQILSHKRRDDGFATVS